MSEYKGVMIHGEVIEGETLEEAAANLALKLREAKVL